MPQCRNVNPERNEAGILQVILFMFLFFFFFFFFFSASTSPSPSPIGPYCLSLLYSLRASLLPLYHDTQVYLSRYHIILIDLNSNPRCLVQAVLELRHHSLQISDTSDLPLRLLATWKVWISRWIHRVQLRTHFQGRNPTR